MKGEIWVVSVHGAHFDRGIELQRKKEYPR